MTAVEGEAEREPETQENDQANPTLTGPGFERITQARFDALASWSLNQAFRHSRTPASSWAADGERVLALVHTGDELADVHISFFTRDSGRRFRPVQHSERLPTVRFAEKLLTAPAGAKTAAAVPDPRIEDPGLGVNLFAPVASARSQNAAFRYLRDGYNQSAARELLGELRNWVRDLDGNLVKDFQTSGYSARVWELYLRFAFREMNLLIGDAHPSPDFELISGEQRVFVEATTVNASGGQPIDLKLGKPPSGPENLMAYLEEVMPLKFGSPLYSKMQMRYWELPHVQGHPFVLAVADFHDHASMTWSHNALPIYLYGQSAEIQIDNAGAKVGTTKILEGFERKAETLLPFFKQEEAENISAILSSNAGTIAKFNRMGVRAGFGDPFVELRRSGGRHRPGADAYEPIPFVENVEAGSYDEHWADELTMFHNPDAIHPIDEALFPGISHYRVENDEVVWRGPPQPVLFSQTSSFDLLKRDEQFAPFVASGKRSPARRSAKSGTPAGARQKKGN